ncbi:hypothetical protein [Flagellimonas onchidii]|uniref:hypothetical protein n=1 Tax=Flagellimonas onchidii TaxID=2562684 RepID=UPI0010A68E78|nr:hypothetical protein [Allomuricauda onchidii]
MRIFISTLILLITATGFGQKKIKITKNPVAWSYQITPKALLPDELRNYAIHVETDLDPMTFWGEIDWRLQHASMERSKKERLLELAKQDTINKWVDNHMVLRYPDYVRTKPTEFTITLNTDQFSVDSLNTNIDYEDQESLLGIVNVSARLTLELADGSILLDQEIPYYIDDFDGPTKELRLKHLILNPSFKLKFKMTKKPEKKKKLLAKRIKKFDADILEYYIRQAGKILKDEYQNQKINAYSAVFGIKNKGFEALNDATEIAQSSINALSALSKKKRKTFDQVKPDLEYARDYFSDKLSRTDHPKVQSILNANLATVHLLLNDVETAKLHLQKVPEFHELNSKTIWEGSFAYYLQELGKAIKIKEKYLGRAELQNSGASTQSR